MQGLKLSKFQKKIEKIYWIGAQLVIILDKMIPKAHKQQKRDKWYYLMVGGFYKGEITKKMRDNLQNENYIYKIFL